MIIFKIALIILVAFPVIYFAWYEFRKVLRHVRDLNNRDKAERKRKEAIAAAARESEPEPVSSRYAQSARTRYEDPMFAQPQNEYADPRYTQQMQGGYTQQLGKASDPRYTGVGYQDTRYTQPVQGGYTQQLQGGYTQQMQNGYTQQLQNGSGRQYTQQMSGYIEPMEEDFQPAPKQAYEDQYVEPVRKKKTTRRRKNGRR